MRPAAHPADARLEVKIVLLLAVGVQFARKGDVGEFTRAGGGKGVLAFGAVEVAVEEAARGVSGFWE